MAREPLLRRLAREVLGEEIASRIWRRIEIVGDIAIIRRPLGMEAIEPLRILAERLLKELPYVRSVWLACTPVEGSERVRKYIHLAGERRSETVYREHGCVFRLDITKVYISPVLSYDHARIARMVRPGERILNMFAGIGGYSIVASRLAKPSLVLSIDLNPHAVRYLRENIELNKVEEINEVVHGEAISITESMEPLFDRVLAPLPELWRRALEAATHACRGQCFIHPHIFVEAPRKRDAFREAASMAMSVLEGMGLRAEVVGGHVVRSVGPRRYQVSLDLRVLKA